MSALQGLIHAKDRIGIVFVSDLIHLLAPSFAHVKAVRTIDHDAVNITDVLISMHDTFRHQDGFRMIRAHDQRHHVSEGFGLGAIIPHAEFEI